MKQVIKRFDDDGVGLRCHACDRFVARATEVTVNVFDGPPSPEASIVVDKDVPIGLVIELEPGFVNATKRHSSGLPWYIKRRGSAGKPKSRVRLPAVLTCGCGEDNFVPTGAGTDDPTGELGRP